MINYESLIAGKERIAVVGMGYVGLPLAVHLARHFLVEGYDLNIDRIHELKKGSDRTLEVSSGDLDSVQIEFTHDAKDLASCRLIIIAVPTPIDSHCIPDLQPIQSASMAVGKHMVKGSCIVYESTVYPGATEEICVPILEKESGLRFGRDFTVGYSPERINPGDKIHTIDKIVKIVSGSDQKSQNLLKMVYGKIVNAGIHEVSSIKVAEAAKVIENTQRDINIALMNELALIFDKMNIDTIEVLEAAETKWNFMPFRPGLVGGHCIGVDPYYLTFKAESLGYHPEMILAGRRLNDHMNKFIAEKTVKFLINAGRQVYGSKVAVLGITFKEDVPDLRNTKVVDIVTELEDYGIHVLVHDPMADPQEAMTYYGIKLSNLDDISNVDAVIIAVSHEEYKKWGLSSILKLCTKGKPLVVDVKGGFFPGDGEKDKLTYWRL